MVSIVRIVVVSIAINFLTITVADATKNDISIKLSYKDPVSSVKSINETETDVLKARGGA